MEDEVLQEETVDTPVDETTEEASTSESETYYTPGDRKCFVYFDVRLTHNYTNSQILSIAMVDANGHSFYAEFTDFHLDHIDTDTFINVLKKFRNPQTVLNGNAWTMKGTADEIRAQIYAWLNAYVVSSGHTVQFVTDLGYLKFCKLVELLSVKDTFNNLPAWISPVYIELNQDLSTLMYRTKPVYVKEEIYDYNYLPSVQALGVNRDEATSSYMEQYKELLTDITKQNELLYVTYRLKELHQHIWKL